MVDDVDQAQEKMDIGLAYAIRMASIQPMAAKGTGRCLYCDECVPEGARWCDCTCRDAFQKTTGVK